MLWHESIGRIKDARCRQNEEVAVEGALRLVICSGDGHPQARCHYPPAFYSG